MADREDFATAVGALIKAGKHRLDNAAGSVSLDSAGGVQHYAGGTRVWWVNDQGVLAVGKVRRLDNDSGSVLLDSSGGLQHYVNGSRVFWVNDQGEMVQGTVPWERITGAPDTPATAALKVAPLALTTGYTGTAASTSRSARIPMRYNAELGRFRVHIRNWNPRLGTIVAAPVDFTGLWLADTTGAGAIAGTPRQLSGAFTTPSNGDEWVSDWYDAPLGGNIERLLCYGYDTAQAPWALTGGSYQAAGSGSAITGAVSRATLTAFDIWIEAETPATTPIIAGIGDSLTAGVGADLPMHESWLSQYARRVGGLPMHIAHSGDSMRGFITINNAKFTRWKHLARADAVVWGLGSNDIAGAFNLATMQADYGTISAIVERDIGPIRYVSTVQPRNGWDATKEAQRESWNAWLTARPGLRGVFDFASIVSNDGDTLIPAYDSGDGTHLNTAGYAAEADSITTPITAPAPATADRVDALSALLHDSGIRSITGQNIASGTIRFQAKNGWCYLDLTNVNLSGEGGNTTILPNNGQLSGYAPSSPMQGKGQVTEVNTSRSYRIVVNYWGGVAIYGAPTGTVLNGYAIWPLNRPAPAMPPGDPT